VADGAGLDDPCLRRQLAVWALDQVESSTDLAPLHAVLASILDLPLPEEELVNAILEKVTALPFDDQVPLIVRAWHAGHRDSVESRLSAYSPDQLVQLYRAGHIDNVFDMLNSVDQHAVFLEAAVDDHLAASTRIAVIDELTDGLATLPDDVHRTLIAATKSADCEVAGVAALALDRRGDHSHVPKWPATTRLDAMMRSLCVLATFEQQQRANEPSYLPGYVAPSGFQLTHEIYDPYVDPPDRRAVDRVPAAQAVLPELDDLIVAMHHCTDAVCRSTTREFHFGFARTGGGLLLSSIEVVDLPPCMAR
jgi:hypothetical protein